MSNKFDSAAFLSKYKGKATPHRLKILKALVKKPWFQASSADIQDELATLPQTGKDNHDGFLEDLVRRKDDIGNVTVKRMLHLPRGYYTICPVFEVYNPDIDKTYTYEYAAYRHGVPAGFKGLVLIRPNKNSEPTHMIVLSGEKFATAEHVYDLMGGLPEVDVDERREVVKGIVREIREETGVKNLKVDEIKLLGSLIVDPGHTSHESHLFVAYVNSDNAKEITTHAKNIDDFEMNTSVHILPLSEMKALVKKTGNSMLLASFAKALAEGIIPMKYCIEELSDTPPHDHKK